MKLCRVLFGALMSVLLAACSVDSPIPASVTEDYVRSFVKEFGIPAQGHDFSMARSAGLKVKASTPTHVTVTAEIDGEEYLFGDLTVPAGITPIPVTIPSTVGKLNLHIGMAKYSVMSDDLIDLDHLSDPTPDSRYVQFSPELNSGQNIVVKDDGNKYYFFFSPEIIRSYFRKYPQGQDIQFKETTDAWTDLNPPLYETRFGNKSYSSDYLIFPIYRRNSPNGNTHYQWRLGYSIYKNGYSTLYYQTANITGTNFPGLGYTYNKKNLAWDYAMITDFSDLNKDFVFDTESTQSCPLDDDKAFTIISEGQKVSLRSNTQFAVRIDLIYSDTSSDENREIVSSTDPSFNYRRWNGNYFRTTLGQLNTAYASTCRKLDGYGRQIRVYNAQTNSAQKVSVSEKYVGYVVGFSAPPSKPDDTYVRDCADALFIIIPLPGNLREYKYLPISFKKYNWIIAAEDLGGSFDWDFNDAVFRFTDVIENLATAQADETGKYVNFTPTDAVSVRKITVEPLAAGGTMPLYITYTGQVLPAPDMSTDPEADYYTANEVLRAHMSQTAHVGTYIIGTEIHKWLGGSSHTQMINTGSKVDCPPGEKISFAIPTSIRPENFSFSSIWASASVSNQPLMGFSVLVDKENKLDIDARDKNGIIALPEYQLGKDDYLIGRPDESKDNIAPQMLLIGYDGWQWPRERVNIKDAYPKFADWVTSFENTTWYSYRIFENLTQRE